LNDRPEIEVIRDARSGDTEALRQIYESYKGPVFTYCLRMLRDRSDAADATQEAFLHALSGLRGLDHTASFKYWLFAIVRNEVYGRIRRRSARTMVPLEEVEDVLWDEETPLEAAVRGETGEAVRRMVDALRPEYREVLLLRELRGFTYAEIAAVTGGTEAAVKARLFKARKALAERYTELVGRRDSS
jgi:RNA polymerase sigma-70 factor (ECF subfamily)